jgi:sialic acid synthase
MFKKQSKDTPYIIAEVGQNHQGSLENAIEFIEIFSRQGANAIKFQTRDNKALFSKEAYEKPYNSENAFAESYGAHRELLELNIEWLPILKEECKKNNVDFMSTPFDESSLEILDNLDIDILKIASFDLGNLPFIDKIGATKRPVVLSVGGGQSHHIDASVEALLNHHSDIAVLHCVSEYPCEYDRLGLSNIENLIEKYPECTIGSSDHFNGILSGPIAYMKGARVFEKHVTLNRAWKGTDHSFALEPNGFNHFTRDLNRTPKMMNVKPKEELGSEFVFQKLGKSIVAYEDISEGQELSLDNLSGVIFSDQYIPVRESHKLIGEKINKPIRKGEPISYDDLY